MPNANTRPKRGRRHRRTPREDPARNELVSRSLESAQECLFKQDYGPAFVHYLLVLNLAPVLKDFARESFRFTLFKWADELDSLGRIQDLFDCYEQALELFPRDEVIINSMGEHLFRMGFRDEAASHFHKALKLRPDFPEARENFHRVANWLVERWHFLMLNDRRRNQQYQQAIRSAVDGGCSTVLDIGTGTGILGMCAQKAGAAEVYACELSRTMYELACQVLSANGMDGRIHVLHMKSLDMEVPKDIPRRVSLVVTETVDAGLFGEGIIESLIHAWKHLLLPPQGSQDPSAGPAQTGRVIPAGATVFGMAVQSLEIRRHHRLCVSEVGGVAMAAAGELHSPVSCGGPDSDDSTEPYTTERLSRLPGGYTSLTEPFRALDIDFNSLQELEGLSSREVRQVRLPVTQGGLLDALAVWFQLHLDRDNSLSTGPHEDTCWEQAIYPVQTPHSVTLKRGDELVIQISCSDAYLRLCSVAVVRDGREFRLEECMDLPCSSPSPNPDLSPNPDPSPNTEAELCSSGPNPNPSPNPDTNPSPNPDPNPSPNPDPNPNPSPDTNPSSNPDTSPSPNTEAELCSSGPNPNPEPNPSPNPEAELCCALASLQTDQRQSRPSCLLESSEMALLNNQHYHQSFSLALAKLISSLKAARQGQGSEVGPGDPDDLSDPFYVLDVSEGFSLLPLMAAAHGRVKGFSSVEKRQQQEVLGRLARANGVPERALEFWLNHVEDEQAVLQRPNREKLWSAIVLDCVETCGLIRQKLMEKASLARCLLEAGGRVFPERVVVHGLLVESDTLLLESAVQGLEPTLGFNIAPYINQFTVPVHVFLDLSTLACRHLSPSVELFVLDLMNTNSNYASRDVRVQASCAGRVTAVPFWYQLHLDGELSVSTFSQDSHWKQAAAVLQQPLEVRAGDWVRLAVQLHKSSISISASLEPPGREEDSQTSAPAMDSSREPDV